MLVPGSPVFYHALQCMRNAALETERFTGPTPLEQIFEDQLEIYYHARDKLSIDRAKDSVDMLSLRHLPNPATRVSAEAIRSHWELAIRINNAAFGDTGTLDEGALVQFFPPVSHEHINKVQSE